MSFKEQRGNLAKELETLVDAVKEGDEVAVKRADEIVAELEQIDEHLAKAAEKAERLSGLTKTTEKEDSKMETKTSQTLGDAAVAAVEAAGLKRGEVAGKAATDTIVSPNPGRVDYRDRIGGSETRPVRVRDLFSQEETGAPTVGFFTLGMETPNPSTGVVAPYGVLEGAHKPQLSASAELTTVPLKKIAAIMKMSDEVLDDYPRLVSGINTRATYLLDAEIDRQLIRGLGTDGEIPGLIHNSDIQTISVTVGQDDNEAVLKANAVLEAALAIEAETGFRPDAVVMSAADFLLIRTAATTSGEYLGANFFEGGDLIPSLWGMRLVVTDIMLGNPTSILVGAFRAGASVVTRGGRRVEVGYDGDDFSHDRVTTRMEERIALATYVPGAFRKVVAETE